MKRLIICADGTWNLRDQVDESAGKRAPTNVTKVARTIMPRSSKGVDQVVYYHAGVGTHWGIDRVTGGAFGTGVSENVRELYRFIISNYAGGDELYLFGFSRGAFTVRSLLGFMKKVGLLEKDDDYWVPEIFQMYERSAEFDWRSKFRNVRGTRECPPIRFIGLWDTVGALGAPGFIGKLLHPGKYEFHDVALNDYVQNAFQALAIDEHRKPFAPNIWIKPPGWKGNLAQAWFPGAHSNVGGGYSPDGLANEALHWLADKAEALGLEFDKAVLNRYKPCFNSVRRDSFSVAYRIFGRHLRPIGQHAAHGECVHRSAIDRVEYFSDYKPENLRAQLGGQPTSLPRTSAAGGSNGNACSGTTAGEKERVK